MTFFQWAFIIYRWNLNLIWKPFPHLSKVTIVKGVLD